MITYFLLLGAAAFASAEPPPPACDYYQCRGRVAEIARAFEAAGPVGPAPYLGSGECYHLSPHYNPDTTHYGVVLLDDLNEETYMGGQFGFFFPENPYREWDLVRARKENARLFESNHRITREAGFSYVDMNPGGQEIWQYWLKQSPEHLYVLGVWGTSQMFYCELSTQ